MSVVIANWNTRDYLRECLSSLEPYAIGCPDARPSTAGAAAGRAVPLASNEPAATAAVLQGVPHSAGRDDRTVPLSVEVIVVDNASTDRSAEVAASFPWCHLIANATNRGWAGGNNQGIELSQGRAILLLNPDTVVLPGSLEALLDCLDRHPGAAAVGARLVNPDGSPQASCRGFPDPVSLLFEVTGLARLFPRHPRLSAYRMSGFGYDREAEVDQPMGSALAMRRDAMSDVGPIDEAFPIFFNDVDWCYRAKAAGWKVYFTPAATIRHAGGASTRQVRPQMIRESHRSLARFLRKHYAGRIHPLLLAAALAAVRAGETVRWVIARFRGS